jgi:hypothetical protein
LPAEKWFLVSQQSHTTMLESQGLPRRPLHLTNLYRPVWQRRTRGKGFGKEGRSLAIFNLHFELSTYWWEHDPVAPTLRFFCVFFVFSVWNPVAALNWQFVSWHPKLCVFIYFVKRASGNIWCIDRETESRSGGHYARFRIVRKIAKEFIELNDNSCGYFGSCNWLSASDIVYPGDRHRFVSHLSTGFGHHLP